MHQRKGGKGEGRCRFSKKQQLRSSGHTTTQLADGAEAVAVTEISWK